MNIELLFVVVIFGFIGYKVISFFFDAILKARSVKNNPTNNADSNIASGDTQEEEKTCWSVLGINASCSDDDLQRAYRTLIKKYHPDKVESLGDEFKEIAKARSQQINAAYEEARRQKGLSAS